MTIAKFDLLDSYLGIQKQLHDYFGYVEDWKVFPIDDAREFYWKVDGGSVRFDESPENLADLDDEEFMYSNEIYTYRHMENYVYRGTDFTMILVDTHCDGNKFCQIFDNSKEVK